MNTRNWCCWWLIACLGLFAFGCESSDVGSTDPSVGVDGKEDSPAPPLDSPTLQQIDETLAELGKILVADKDAQKSVGDFLNDVYQLLKSRPVIEKWGTEPADSKEPSLVFANFKGGMKYVLQIIKKDPATGTTPVLRSRSATAEASIPGEHVALATNEAMLSFGARKTHVVGDKMLFADLNEEFTNMGAKLADKVQKYGYKDITVGKTNGEGFGTVDSFRNLGQYSFIYVGGHGTYLKALNTYAIQTAEHRTPEKDELYWKRRDFQNDRVVFGDEAITEKDRLKAISMNRTYLITARFLNDYVTAFPENSVAIFDLCKSTMNYGTGFENLPGESLPATLQAKNLTTMYGWNFRVQDHIAAAMMTHLFDKALVEADEATPPNIPQSLDTVYADAVKKKLNVDPIEQGVFLKFQLKSNAPDFFLRPSMKEIRVDPAEKGRELIISGMVGEDGGEVCFAQDCRAVSAGADWVDETVTTALPDDFIGPITVKVKGHPSNQLILNEWRGSMEMLWSGEKICTVHATLNFSLRCEFSKKRNELTRFLTDPFCGTKLAQDSAVSYYVDGKWTEGNELVECSGEGRLTGATLLSTSAGLNPSRSVISVGGMAYSQIKRTNQLTGTVSTGMGLAFTPMFISFTTGRDGIIPAGNYSLPSTTGNTIEWRWDSISPHFGIAP